MGRRQRGSGEREARGFTGKATAWLGLVGTVVAIATGMFTLRDAVRPEEAGNARASIDVYETSVADVCEALNDSDRARAHSDAVLRKALGRAHTTAAQHEALLDSARRAVARSTHDIARFEAVDVPPRLERRHEATVGIWHRNVEVIRDYAHRLDVAARRSRMLAAVRFLADSRTVLSRRGEALAANLRRLSGGRCRLDPPIVTKPIKVPAAPAVNSPMKKARPRPIAVNPPDPRAGVTPPPGSQPSDPGDEPTEGPTVNAPAPREPLPPHSETTAPAPATHSAPGGAADGP